MTPSKLISALLFLATVLFAASTSAFDPQQLQSNDTGLGPDVVATVGAPGSPPPSPGEVNRRTESASSHIRCPVCQGHAIADSPAETARNMKEQVRRMIAVGYTDEQVYRYFETSYGEFVRLLPRAEGFNWLVWLLPLAGLLVGALVVGSFIRGRGSDAMHPRATKNTEDKQKAALRATDELEPWLARVRQEMNRDE